MIIGFEDITANAFIECLKKSQKSRFLSYEQLNSYGSNVAKVLEEQKEPFLIYFSRYSIDEMLDIYAGFFVEKKLDGELGIYLRPEKGISDLRNKFRGYLSIKALQAFTNETVVAQSFGG